MLIVFAVVLANAQFAAAVALKVMPLGDSITAGCTADTGPWGGAYRTKLWQDFGSSAANLDFLGSVQSDPNNPPELGDRDNEGHSGYTIQYVPGRGNLYDNIPTWLNSSVNPDVILMMIGTNDIFGNYDVANAPTRLSQLISRITTQKPSAKLIVASITPALDPTINGRVTTFNAAIPSIVDTHKLNGEQVYYVDMYSAMTTPATDILPDGAHPSASGYVKMGDAWYGAIQFLQDHCSDSLDNDGDGLVDYPADPGCVDAADLSERDPFLFCDDGADNDGDGLVDLADPDCTDANDPLEAPDADDDLVEDDLDNCVHESNPLQEDTDGDDYGNACDCDFDQNLTCSIADFSIFREDYIATVDRGVGTDMDGNGTVSIADFSLFRDGYAAGAPGPSGLVP